MNNDGSSPLLLSSAGFIHVQILTSLPFHRKHSSGILGMSFILNMLCRQVDMPQSIIHSKSQNHPSPTPLNVVRRLVLHMPSSTIASSLPSSLQYEQMHEGVFGWRLFLEVMQQ
jgi:hypothetical protein